MSSIAARTHRHIGATVALAAVVPVAAYGLLSAVSDCAWCDVDSVLSGARGSIYGTLSSIFGGLLGFQLASAGLFVSVAESARFKPLFESGQGERLRIVFLWAMITSGVACLSSLVALFFERGHGAQWIMTAVVASTVMAGVAMTAWVIAIVNGAIGVITARAE